MRDRRARRAAERGFTLLELLVVITIFGLLLTALTGGVRFASRAWESQDRLIARQGDLDAVQNVLRQLIASGRSFSGGPASFHFVGTMPQSLRREGLFDIALAAADGRLVLAWQPHYNGPADAEAFHAVLAENVTGVRIAYFVAADDEPGAWLRELDKKDAHPALIRIALQTADGRAWPPLVVAPMIEGNRE
jgi:general secretion pathway protein J